MTGHEHIAWAERRALNAIDAGRPREAIASLVSDLQKWDGGDLATYAVGQHLEVTQAFLRLPHDPDSPAGRNVAAGTEIARLYVTSTCEAARKGTP